MKAARLVGPKLFELLETETPSARDGQCLVRLERVSVCGSDIRHGFAVNPEEMYPMPIGHPCHELAGTIVDSRANEYHGRPACHRHPAPRLRRTGRVHRIRPQPHDIAAR